VIRYHPRKQSERGLMLSSPAFSLRYDAHKKLDHRTTSFRPSHSRSQDNDDDDDVELALLITSDSSELPTPEYDDDNTIDPPVKEMKAPNNNWRTGNNCNAISSCTLYSACSVSMILVNKTLTSRYVVSHLYRFYCCSRIVVVVLPPLSHSPTHRLPFLSLTISQLWQRD